MKEKIRISDTEVEQVEEICCLGSVINIYDDSKTLRKESDLHKGHLTYCEKFGLAETSIRNTKLKIFRSNIKSMLLYRLK